MILFSFYSILKSLAYYILWEHEGHYQQMVEDACGHKTITTNCGSCWFILLESVLDNLIGEVLPMIIIMALITTP